MKIDSSARRIRIAETGNIWYRVTEGAMTGLWEPSLSNTGEFAWGYKADSQLHAMGTVVVEQAIVVESD